MSNIKVSIVAGKVCINLGLTRVSIPDEPYPWVAMNLMEIWWWDKRYQKSVANSRIMPLSDHIMYTFVHARDTLLALKHGRIFTPTALLGGCRWTSSTWRGITKVLDFKKGDVNIASGGFLLEDLVMCDDSPHASMMGMDVDGDIDENGNYVSGVEETRGKHSVFPLE